MSAGDTHAPGRETDHNVLAFLAAHRIVLATHVQALLGVEHQHAHDRLKALEDRRLVSRTRLSARHSGYYQITHLGLAVIASDLPPPQLCLDRCRHDLGVAWVWLAAVRGKFGRVDHVLSDREQRARDAARPGGHPPGDGDAPPFGVRVADAPATLHYPDVLLVARGVGRVPVELVFTSNGQRQLETVMASYAADPNIVAVLYLAETAAARQTIKRTVAQVAIENLIHIHPVAIPKDNTSPAPSAGSTPLQAIAAPTSPTLLRRDA